MKMKIKKMKKKFYLILIYFLTKFKKMILILTTKMKITKFQMIITIIMKIQIKPKKKTLKKKRKQKNQKKNKKTKKIKKKKQVNIIKK